MQRKPVHIYKGKTFTKMKQVSSQGSHISRKVIVFDLDETLGAFGEMFLLWSAIEPYMGFMDKKMVFHELLELYPEFLRPGVLSILEFLNYKKKAGLCSSIFLYTNNQCPKEWVDLILEYFEERLKAPGLFDKVVYAFKINNKIVEPLRTSHSKIYSDLIRCTLMPKNSELCFIDNTYHRKMDHDRVFYIQPKSYEHGLLPDDIINRFMRKWLIFPLPDQVEQSLRDWFSNIRGNKDGSVKESLVVSQKIMYHLKEYFLLSTKMPKTKKISFGLGRFTRKKRG
jgi:hypothetical protein